MHNWMPAAVQHQPWQRQRIEPKLLKLYIELGPVYFVSYCLLVEILGGYDDEMGE